MRLDCASSAAVGCSCPLNRADDTNGTNAWFQPFTSLNWLGRSICAKPRMQTATSP